MRSWEEDSHFAFAHVRLAAAAIVLVQLQCAAGGSIRCRRSCQPFGPHTHCCSAAGVRWDPPRGSVGPARQRITRTGSAWPAYLDIGRADSAAAAADGVGARLPRAVGWIGRSQMELDSVGLPRQPCTQAGSARAGSQSGRLGSRAGRTRKGWARLTVVSAGSTRQSEPGACQSGHLRPGLEAAQGVQGRRSEGLDSRKCSDGAAVALATGRWRCGHAGGRTDSDDADAPRRAPVPDLAQCKRPPAGAIAGSAA